MRLRSILREGPSDNLEDLAARATSALDGGNTKLCLTLVQRFRQLRATGHQPDFPNTDEIVDQVEQKLMAVQAKATPTKPADDLGGKSDEEFNDFRNLPSDKSIYRNPDEFYTEGSLTFIYGGKDRLLYMYEYPISHEYMMKEKYVRDELFAGSKYQDRTHEIGNHVGKDNKPVKGTDWHSYAQSVALLGRVSADRGQVSVWNQNPDIIQKLMPGAIKELAKEGVVSVDTVVYAPCYPRPVPANRVDQAQTEELTPEQSERIELMRRLHIAVGAEKEAIRKKLGMKTPAGKRSPNAVAMQNVGMLKPGHKWWAPHSESLSRRLDRLFGVR